jgi:hypothetical protein
MAKKDPIETGKKVNELNLHRERERLKSMQQEMLSKQTKVQIHKFEKKVQMKRKIFGNPALAREEKGRRKENHLLALQAQATAKKEFLRRVDSTDEVSLHELQPFSSTTTVLTCSTHFLFSDEIEKRCSNRCLVQSPFVPKLSRPSTALPKHFYEEDRGHQSAPQSQQKHPQDMDLGLEVGFHEDSVFEEEEDLDDNDTDIFASEPTDDHHSASFSLKRSGTGTGSAKRVEDFLRAESRSTVLEHSLSMAETSAYDGNPNVTNYFGEEARKRFFLLFNRSPSPSIPPSLPLSPPSASLLVYPRNSRWVTAPLPRSRSRTSLGVGASQLFVLSPQSRGGSLRLCRSCTLSRRGHSVLSRDCWRSMRRTKTTHSF